MKYLALLLLLAPGLCAAEPVSAIAAIGSIIGSGVGAGIAGMTIAQGAMLAGGALNLVGNFAGNKKLQRLGGLMAAGGGIANALGGAASSATQATEGMKSAAAESLGQTAVTPVEQVAQQAMGEAPVNAARNAAQNGVSQSALATGSTGSAAQSGGLVAGAQGAAGAPPSSLLDHLTKAAKGVGGFIKDNKELVNLGGGLVKGAMEAGNADKILADKAQRDEAERQRYSNSVRDTRVNMTVNPGVNPTANRPAQDPMRYAPRRGLIRYAQGA